MRAGLNKVAPPTIKDWREQETGVRVMDEGEGERYHRARICIDFGTALSKASVCLDPTLPLEVGVKPLPIGAIARAEHPLLTPSVLYVNEGRLFFGQNALERARRSVEGAGDPLLSFKTVLGASNVGAALASKLKPSMDPTGTLLQRDALVLYLAYLDQLIRETIDLAPNIPNVVIGAPRRYTSPVWKPGSGVDRTFEGIFNEGAAVSERIGQGFFEYDGIPIEVCKEALQFAAARPGKGLLETGIFEPHAAAATALAFSNEPTRFVLVFDMGAGTVDFAAFEFDETTNPPALSEIKEARQCSALAGDEIDRIMIELFVRKRGGEKSRDEELRNLRSAKLTARDMKKELFATGKTALKGGWFGTVVRLNELMEDPNFRTYVTALRNTMAVSLSTVVARAEAVGAPFVDVVLAGGGSHLPFMTDLVRSAADQRPSAVKIRVGPLSPSNPLYGGIDPALRDVFPQIAMSVGGALVEMMPSGR